MQFSFKHIFKALRPKSDPKTRQWAENTFNALALFVFLAFLFVILSFLTLSEYRTSLFKSDSYWRDLQQSNKSACDSSNRLNPKSLLDLNNFLRYMDKNRHFSYFLCFSSLYYAVKIEQCDIFRAVLNSSEFNFNKKPRQSCILGSELNGNYDAPAVLHLCFIKFDEANICAWLSKFSTTLKCEFNLINGEYLVKLNAGFHFRLHHYNFRFKSDMPENAKNSSVEFMLDDTLALDLGLYGHLLGSDYLDLPGRFFYSRENRQKSYFYFLNYLNATFRLPAEIIDYFMWFYPNVWFL